MIEFNKTKDTWHCYNCHSKNFGEGAVDLFEFQLGTMRSCLCKKCATDLAVSIVNCFESENEDENDRACRV